VTKGLWKFSKVMIENEFEDLEGAVAKAACKRKRSAEPLLHFCERSLSSRSYAVAIASALRGWAWALIHWAGRRVGRSSFVGSCMSFPQTHSIAARRRHAGTPAGPLRGSPKSQVPSPKSQVPSPKSQVPSPKSQGKANGRGREERGADQARGLWVTRNPRGEPHGYMPSPEQCSRVLILMNGVGP
jgi:hypothetical protein